MKNETKVKIIYIAIACCLITFIILFYSNNGKEVSENINSEEASTEIITEEITEEMTEETTTEIVTEEIKEEINNEINLPETTTKTTVKKEVKVFDNNIYVDMLRKNIALEYDVNSAYCKYYYDLPYINVKNKSLVNMDAINKINAYLEADYENWLNGESRMNFYDKNRGSWFVERVNEYVKRQGESYMAENPLLYTVDSEVMLLNNDRLSIKQYVYIMGGGPSSMATFGLTFDLKTGEVLPIDKLINVNADELKNKVIDFLKIYTNKYYGSKVYDEFYEVYKPNENHDFKLNAISKRLDLNYSYYYDGEYYYLILEEFPVYNDSTIIKWNGNLNDDIKESFVYATSRKNGEHVTEKYNVDIWS